LGAHRVLFASGFPGQNPGAALGLLLDSRLSENEKQAILTTSAVRLFGLTRQG
jgi:predicted TIM-barrel fold metal-dependent hydrolase